MLHVATTSRDSETAAKHSLGTCPSGAAFYVRRPVQVFMRFGIIGLGNHAKTRVMPSLSRTGHKIDCIYSRSIEKARIEAAKYGSEPFSNLDKMLARDFDAVYIASPNFLHFEQARLSLLRLKHVLLEKPMTLRNEEAKELVDIAAGKHLALAVGFHLRFHPAVREVRSMVQNGSLGTLTYASGMWAHFSSRNYDDPEISWWGKDDQVGGGSVMGTGVHVIDSLKFILGQLPRSVSALRVPAGQVIDMTEHVTMDFDGTIADAISSRSIQAAENSLYLCGTKGTVAVRGMYSTSVNASIIRDGKAVQQFSGTDMYDEEVRAFVDLAEGRASSIAQGQDGYAVVRIVNAAVESDRQGKKISL